MKFQIVFFVIATIFRTQAHPAPPTDLNLKNQGNSSAAAIRAPPPPPPTSIGLVGVEEQELEEQYEEFEAVEDELTLTTEPNVTGAVEAELTLTAEPNVTGKSGEEEEEGDKSVKEAKMMDDMHSGHGHGAGGSGGSGGGLLGGFLNFDILSSLPIGNLM
eukprot:Pgem_evm1s9719